MVRIVKKITFFMEPESATDDEIYDEVGAFGGFDVSIEDDEIEDRAPSGNPKPKKVA